MEELSVTFDEKLAPLKVEIAELRYFIENAENANQKYDQVLEKLTEQEKACKEIKKENNFLKSTVNTCTWFSEQETNGKFNIRFQGPNIWNTIDDKIEAVSFSQFNSKLKQHIFRCTNIGNYLVLRNFHPTFSLFLQ